MINFDSLTLKALINEIKPILESGRVQKIQQPSRHEILLGVRAGGKNHKLYICINPKYPHICLLTEEGEKYRDIEIPVKPPMFCMLLRKHMEGAKIKLIRQPEHERIFEIYFDSYNELGERIPLVLACELMGKHSNIVLYNYDNNVILGCAHNVGPEKSRERELSGGLPYIYPQKPQKIDLSKVSESDFCKKAKNVSMPIDSWLNESFFDISLALANELCSVVGESITALYKLTFKTLKLENLNPSISNDKKLFSLVGLLKDVSWQRLDSVNAMVDLYFGYQIYLDRFSRLKKSLLAAAIKELKKEKSRYTEYEKTLEKEDKAEKYRQIADIIMANIHKIPEKAEEVQLENFFEEGNIISIQLDKNLSPSANAQRYYKLYNKAKNAARISKDLINKSKDEIYYLETVIESINQSETVQELKLIQEELAGQNISKEKPDKYQKKAKKEEIQLTQFTSREGFKIYLGKNNRQNDYLISKIASSNDIWLHTQNIPGSHVLIKVPPDMDEVPETTMNEALNLAAYYSQGRESSNVPVIYTRRKFLKKPPGAKPGYVTYSHEKTAFVTPDESLIQNNEDNL
jgi:predicted ribosome quality control (RQC) complex YloA/Tae2 family protein